MIYKEKIMIFNNMKYVKLTIIILVSFVLICFSLSGCRSQSKTVNEDEALQKQRNYQAMESKFSSNAHLNIDEAPVYSMLHSRLEYSKFQSIISSNEQISMISILYRDVEYTQGGDLSKARSLSMGTGYAGVPQYFSSAGPYRSEYNISDFNTPPGPEGEHEKEIDAESVEEIFDYISLPENRTYFFNGEEYTGLQQPYPAPGRFINNGDSDYIFALAFSEPNDSINVWSISKSTNEPDARWQGLIDIIEENIISQFE
jgi:hypothetical protein